MSRRKVEHEDQEREASEFARCLLMPEEQLRAAVKRARRDGDGDITDLELHLLAKEFQVPVEQALIRLISLDLVRVKP